MDFTLPDPFITELKDTGTIMIGWPECQDNMKCVSGEYPNRVWVIPCWDKYFLELREKINQKEQELGLSQTSWTPLPYQEGKPYIWDKYIQELREAAARLAPRVYSGKDYHDILGQVYGYTEWCNRAPVTNNYIWDRCIDEIRRVIDPTAPIVATQAGYLPGSTNYNYRIANPYGWDSAPQRMNASQYIGEVWSEFRINAPISNQPITYLGFSTAAVFEYYTIKYTYGGANYIGNHVAAGSWNYKFRKPREGPEVDPYPGEPICTFECWYEWPGVSPRHTLHYREPVWQCTIEYHFPVCTDGVILKKIVFPDIAHFYYRKPSGTSFSSTAHDTLPVKVKIDIDGEITQEKELTEGDTTIDLGSWYKNVYNRKITMTVTLPDALDRIKTKYNMPDWSWEDPNTWIKGDDNIYCYGLFYQTCMHVVDYYHSYRFDPRADLHYRYPDSMIE